MLISPLEQFELKIIYGLNFFNYIDISISNSVFFMLFGTFSILLILFFGTFKARILPGPIQRFCELFYVATLRVASEVVGQRGIKYFPIFFSIFLIILGSNIIGLLPQAFAPFSHIITSLSLSIAMNFGFCLIGFYEHSWVFMKLFIPRNAPWWLLPIVICIEFLSYMIRTLSLGIRLFANLMAGHILLHILSGFILTGLGLFLSFISIFPLIVVIFIFLLEVAISLIQAYVFYMLLLIYLNDLLNFKNH